MVWSVRFLDIFIFFLSFPLPMDCIMFSYSIIIQKTGWDGRRYHSYMSGHVFLLVTWVLFTLYKSLSARTLPHHLVSDRL